MYTADVTSSGVQFSNNGGASSATGVFLNKDVDLTGTNQVQSNDTAIQGSGNMAGFRFTFENSKLEANQTAAGSFTFAGTPDQAGAALERAGFNPRWGTEGGNEYRSSGSFWTGANSGHFIVNPNTLVDPGVSVPATAGNMHFGEHNPYSPLGWAPHISEANQ